MDQPSHADSAPDGSRPAVTTIRDVARAAGVSISTVSKALNGRGKLRAETRQRVQQAADRLGFRPNDLAQSLLRGRSYTVGLLTSDSYGRFSIPLMTGVEDALGPSQISVFICDARDDPERERLYIRSLLAKRVDGIIVTARRTDLRAPVDLGHARVPVLYAYTQVPDPDALCVLPNDEQGARLATQHLVRLGRRRLGHITGPLRFIAVRQRLAGMQGVIQEAGLSMPEGRVLPGPWQEGWGYEAATRLLADHPEIDSIFCGSDQLARGVLDALRDRGVRVPDDVAVVGFDNWEIIAAASRPPLTTVDLNLHELGRQAGLRLLSLIAGEPASGVERVPCRLVIRETCGAAAVGAAEKGGDAD